MAGCPGMACLSRRLFLKMRGTRPFVFTNLKTGHGLDEVIKFVIEQGMLETGTQRNAA